MAKTVMIIDDAISTRGLLSMTISNAGYQVIEAGDGKDALQKLGGQRNSLKTKLKETCYRIFPTA